MEEKFPLVNSSDMPLVENNTSDKLTVINSDEGFSSTGSEETMED
tara:strand:- start:787 stop:921 length:135 start_codon:yes stop_codon:yes gene_type:complete